MTAPEKPSDLRAAWHWGVGIGSVLLVIGIVAAAAGPVFIGHESMSAGDHMSKPTPASIRRGLLSDVWLVVQGAIACVIGGGLLALSLIKLHYIRAEEEERKSWENPAAFSQREAPALVRKPSDPDNSDR